jgi:hypothetical protein
VDEASPWNLMELIIGLARPETKEVVEPELAARAAARAAALVLDAPYNKKAADLEKAIEQVCAPPRPP